MEKINRTTKFLFDHWIDAEDGKIARLELTAFGREIPVNVFIDNADEVSIIKGEACAVDVYGICGNCEKLASYDEINDRIVNTESIIPCGTFPANPDDKDFRESPGLIFKGKVIDVDEDHEASEDEPNYCLTISVSDLTLTAFVRYSGVIHQGDIVHGTAWLYGDMEV